MDKIYFSMYDSVHIVFDVFRVGSNNRAVVVVVGIFEFVPLIGNGRVEDMFHAFVDQPLHMAVSQLCRITFGFAGNGLDSQLIDLPGGSRRKYHPEAQFCEKCKPERIVFIHVQYPRDADHSPWMPLPRKEARSRKYR